MNSNQLISGIACECPIDCDEVIYSQEMSQAILKVSNSPIFEIMSTKENFLGKLDEMIKNATNNKQIEALKAKRMKITKQSSVVHFYFKEPGIVKYSREELYGTMDVIGKLD